MLEEIRTFNKLFDLLVLQEGYFHVPKKVYDEILKDYYDVWKKVHSEDIKRISEKSFPIKNYELDFSGTSFEFLNKLDPKPSINVKYVKSGDSFFQLLGKPEADYPKNIGFMQINLTNPVRVVIDLIEHELSHYVQDYIQKYKRIKSGEQNVDVYSPKMPIGGLPSKSIIDSQYTTQGYKIGSKQKRRASHSLRPVEYYPDLLSSIRHLEYAFSKGNPSYSFDPENPTKYEKDKKQFFLNFLNRIKYGEKTGIPLSASIFKTFKTISPEFYMRIVKIAYDAFVNKDPNLNVRDLIKIEDEIKTSPKKEKKINQYFFNANPYYLSLPSSDVPDVVNDVGNIFNIEDGYYAAGEEVLNNFGIYEKYNKREYAHEYNLPKNTNGISKLFKTLKKYKDSNKYIFGDEWRDDIKEKDYPKAYNALFEYFKKIYLNAILDKDKENFNQFLENLNF